MRPRNQPQHVDPSWKVQRPPIDNPYWDLLLPYVPDHRDPTWNTFTVGSLSGHYGETDPFSKRWEWCRRYSWSVPDPATLRFICRHVKGATVVDPFAGSGYWAYLLSQLGQTVRATDIDPPAVGSTANHWHPDINSYVGVHRMDAADAMRSTKPGEVLFLSWPPMSDAAYRALKAFKGNRVIYIGEGWGGCTADDAFNLLLETDWQRVDDHPIVQYYGIHDLVTVYARNRTLTGS